MTSDNKTIVTISHNTIKVWDLQVGKYHLIVKFDLDFKSVELSKSGNLIALEHIDGNLCMVTLYLRGKNTLLIRTVLNITSNIFPYLILNLTESQDW